MNTVLNEEEQAGMAKLLEVMNLIQSWGLKANHEELGHGVHILQGFITQHMLQRVNPEAWASWYETR